MRIMRDLLRRKKRDLKLKSPKSGLESTIIVCGLLNTCAYFGTWVLFQIWVWFIRGAMRGYIFINVVGLWLRPFNYRLVN